MKIHWNSAKAMIWTVSARIGLISDILEIADDMMFVHNINLWHYDKFLNVSERPVVCSSYPPSFSREVESRYFVDLISLSAMTNSFVDPQHWKLYMVLWYLNYYYFQSAFIVSKCCHNILVEDFFRS